MSGEFVNQEKLDNTINDIQLYISKNYKLTPLELEIILNTLLERLRINKLNQKQNSMIKGAMSKLGGLIGK